jgi:uncharacterized phage protein (TIGR01671 family)
MKMREIKFRAWDKERNKMVTAKWRMRITLDGNILWEIDHYDGNFNLIEKEEIDGDNRFVLEQYTGLKDKNGVDIYEGDILDCQDRVVYVRWNEFHGVWDSQFVRYINELCSNGITPVDWKFRATVVGNLHENPELLEGEND